MRCPLVNWSVERMHLGHVIVLIELTELTIYEYQIR